MPARPVPSKLVPIRSAEADPDERFAEIRRKLKVHRDVAVALADLQRVYLTTHTAPLDDFAEALEVVLLDAGIQARRLVEISDEIDQDLDE